MVRLRIITGGNTSPSPVNGGIIERTREARRVHISSTRLLGKHYGSMAGICLSGSETSFPLANGVVKKWGLNNPSTLTICKK